MHQFIGPPRTDFLKFLEPLRIPTKHASREISNGSVFNRRGPHLTSRRGRDQKAKVLQGAKESNLLRVSSRALKEPI